MIFQRLKARISSLKIIVCLSAIIYLWIYYYTYKNEWQNGDKLEMNLNKMKKSQRNEKNYLVWSSNCNIPRLDPFESDVMAIYKPEPPTQCSTGEENMVYKIFNNTTGRYLLHMNAPKNYKLSDIKCCYKEILRGNIDNPDNSYKILPCFPFEQDHEVPTYVNYMIVECYSVKTRKLIFQDAHFFIQENFNIRNGPLNDTKLNNKSLPFGILMFGIDTMSQFNLRRTMPKTFQYLQRNSWIELSGYNKIGDNTFPNLMALLEGIDMDHVYKLCKLQLLGGLDNCTKTWKLFQKMGYVSAYAEDQSHLSTFNYFRKGFVNPPTDYYLRPFTMAIEEHLPIQYKRDSTKYCIGNKQAAEYIFDFAMEFAVRFLKQRVFGLFWTSSFSHDNFSRPSAMDIKMLDYLQQLKAKEVLKNSVVIFFSDHGHRFGPLRQMRNGFLEEIMPMFFISLPEKFIQKHPFYTKTLQNNQHRLISPYDIHMTLKHLLALSVGIPNNFTQATSCATCQTIFKPIDVDRTCAQACIDNNWCACVLYYVVPTYTKFVKKLTRTVINEMNEFIKNQSSGSLCSTLRYERVIEAYNSDASNGTIPYRIRYVVNPGSAEFEVKLSYSELTQDVTMNAAHISRLNPYAKHSKCINDVQLKKYCICKDIN